MSIFDWLFGWKPEKYKWYVFYDRAKSLRDCDLNFDGDRLKVKPYAVINGKKYRGKFYVTSNYCEIIADKNKLIVPLKRCKFRKNLKQYFKGQSRVDEYYFVVEVNRISKEDYERYKTFKKKNLNKIYTCKYCGYHQGVSWDGKLRPC